MESQTQAISFSNSYFALVDGLASGLETQLSRDVVLDWFGRTIKGSKKVASFMEAHMVNTWHIFSRIVPTSSIFHHRQESVKNANDADSESDYLSEGDLCNLFKFEISPANIEEIEQSINRIKLEEDMAPTVERECSEEDGHVNVEAHGNYVEADGEIELSRKFWKPDIRHTYFSATSNFHTWRRPCKLQIAYSILTECPALDPLCETTRDTVPKDRLPSLTEINEITNRLVPNTNDFDGLLRTIDFVEDRKGILKSLEIVMAKDHRAPLFTLQCVKDKLVFNKPCVNVDVCNEENKRKFVFKYQIHLIIYEDSQKCKTKKLSRNPKE
ncbi:LOW QUALITY PROTEIN: uncharacterized protein LOC143220399 [Lasioglossum baleicum]|uniref:LOW QUALITY PROTEIN: uncharacterized protein LOC143220399 n=1 Tax=Lasioglossum baleicum TaxID=434251 RepID=UPI003FCD766A